MALPIMPMLFEILINTVENVIYALLIMKCLSLKKCLNEYKNIFFLFIIVLGIIYTCICRFGEINSIMVQMLFFQINMRCRFHLLGIGVAFTLLLLIVLIHRIGHTYEQKILLENRFYQEQVNKEQLELSNEAIQYIQFWKHDYNNHLITMAGLLKEEKYTELSDYLQQLQINIPEHFSNVLSGNAAIDAIVSSKMQMAKQAGINFQYSIIFPASCPLSDIELTAILGNMLDNALEACTNLILGDNKFLPYIKLLIKPFRDMMQIKIINSSNGNYNYTQKGELCTTKEDNQFHGYGIKRVSDIVKNTNGILKIQAEKDIFTVNILIPISENKEVRGV